MGDWDRILEEATEEERLRLAMQARQARILASSRQRMSIVSGEAAPAEAQPAEEQKPQEAEKPAEEKSEAKLRPLANRRRRVMQQKAQASEAEAEAEAEAASATTAAAEASAEKEKESTAAASAGEAAAAERETTKEQPFATALLTSIPTPTITSEEELAARPLLRRRLVTSRGGSQSREDLAAAADSAAASATTSTPPVVVLPEEAKPKLVFFTAGRALRMVLLVVCGLLGGLSGAIGSYRTQGARELILQHHGHVVWRSHDSFGELPIRGQLQRYRDMLSQPSRKMGLMNDPDVHGRHAHAVDEFEVQTAFESAEASMPVSGVALSALTAVPAIVVAIAAWIASHFALKPTLDKVLPPDARVASSSGILSIATSFLGGLNDYLAAGRAILEHAAVFAFSAVVGGAATEYVLGSS